MAVLLIADDDADVRAVLQMIFTRDGFTVVAAPDGRQALRLAQQHRPDAVLTDLDMPEMDGLSLCRALRADQRLRTVPVAVLSGSLLPGDARADGFALCERLLKPMSNRDLVAVMWRLVERGRHEHDDRSAACLPAA